MARLLRQLRDLRGVAEEDQEDVGLQDHLEDPTSESQIESESLD
jgi:hypothetical protein